MPYKNIEDQKENKRLYYAKKKDLIKLKSIEYYNSNKKSCLERNKKYRAEYNLTHKKEMYEYQKQWEINNKEKRSKIKKKSDLRNPHKIKARQMVGNALITGLLTRGKCELCGKKAEAHHEDYNKPLEVKWLCRQHHTELHMNKAENGTSIL